MWIENQVSLDSQTLLMHKILASHFGLEYLEREKNNSAFGKFSLKMIEVQLLNAGFNVENASCKQMFCFSVNYSEY